MRVTTAFNRVLALPGAWVESVSFADVGIVIVESLRVVYGRARAGEAVTGVASTV